MSRARETPRPQCSRASTTTAIGEFIVRKVGLAAPGTTPTFFQELTMNPLARSFIASALLFVSTSRADDQWVVYQGGEGPGHGKNVVLISGDEEYRSEEALPQLAKILAKYHGFTC